MVLAFTFPGQGSLRPEMGRPWVDHPSWELVADASDVLGRDLSWLLLDAGDEDLYETRNAQLGTFLLSLVVLDAVERLGIAPSVCAGHSLGEYSALVASGALGFEDGVRLVAERGEAMQDVADNRPGRMVALLGVTDDDAEVICQRAEDEVWVANYNAPGQVVLAGTVQGVEAAVALAREMGIRKAVQLAVRGPFHTPLILPARARLRKALSDASFADSEIPVVANVDARPHSAGADWPGLLSTQLCSPVRWHQSLATVWSLLGGGGEGPEPLFVELGGGTVLTGLTKRTLREARAISVAQPGDLDGLVGLLGGASMAPQRPAQQGEHLYVSERIVVSPATGVFQPVEHLAGLAPGRSQDQQGLPLAVGDLVGTVGSTEVRSAFAGRLVGLLAHAGERVVDSQPLAWLRTTEAAG